MQYSRILKYSLSLILSLFILKISAQNANFVSQGRIEFERSINAYALMEIAMKSSDETGGFAQRILDNYKKNNPQFQISKFTLRFNDNHSLYTPVKVDAKMGGFFDLSQLAGANSVYANTQSGQSVAQKNIFGTEYLITDSIRKFVWKITDEYRDIAGFSCRRANGLMFDSVYVVAFYTEQIIPAFGPESFNGLPGMILGIAIPYEHTNWFATKVYSETIAESNLVAPTKGKKFAGKDAIEAIKSATKDWGGDRGNFIINRFML